MGDTFNQTNNDNATGVQGSGNQVTVNHGGDTSPTAEIFEPILKGLEGATWTPDTPEEITTRFENPVAMVKVAQSSADAEIKAGGDKNPERFEAKKTAWFEWFRNIAPWIANGAVKVGVAVLDKYTDQSPTIAGLKAAFDFVSEATPKDGESSQEAPPKTHAVPMNQVPPNSPKKE